MDTSTIQVQIWNCNMIIFEKVGHGMAKIRILINY